MMDNARFFVNTDKCIGCGNCLEVCPGNMVGGDVLRFENGHPVMVDQSNFGWKGCWKCQHCLAVCPVGAISVLGISPEEVPEKPLPGRDPVSLPDQDSSKLTFGIFKIY